MLVKLHMLVSLTNELVWRYWRYTGKFSYIANTSILMLIFTVNAMRLKSERRSVYMLSPSNTCTGGIMFSVRPSSRAYVVRACVRVCARKHKERNCAKIIINNTIHLFFKLQSVFW